MSKLLLATVSPTQTEDVLRFRMRIMAAVVLPLTVVLFIAQLPRYYSFDDFAFGDPGSCLKVDWLLSQGIRPAVDFGYLYGLLPLAVGRVWFGLFGLTPAAYMAAMGCCALLLAWAFVRYARHIRLNWFGIALITSALPITIGGTYPSLTHALEAVLISHALVEQVAGRRRWALALTTACLFVKPSMAYIYGFLLLVLIFGTATRQRGGSRSGLWHELAPATALGVLLLIVLGTWFGWEPLGLTLFPTAGMRHYRAVNYGLVFGVGRDFLLPAGAKWGYYLGTVAGFWVVGNLMLTCAAAFLFAKGLRNHNSSAGISAVEAIITCGLLHLCFTLFLFGNAWSWFYYVYLLVLGLAGLDSQLLLAWSSRKFLVAFLIPFVLLGQKSKLEDIVIHWQAHERSASLAGLWSLPEQRNEWIAILELSQDSPVFILTPVGSPDSLFPTVTAPRYWMLFRGCETAFSLTEVRKGLESKSLVVVPTQSGLVYLSNWPEFRELLGNYRVCWTGKWFNVYRHLSEN